MMNKVEIFTDGACKGNPGPGGWGAILRYGTTEKEIYGSSMGRLKKKFMVLVRILPIILWS